MDFPTKAADQVSPENMLSVRGERGEEVKSELGGKHLPKGFMLWKNKSQILALTSGEERKCHLKMRIYIKLSSDFGNEL